MLTEFEFLFQVLILEPSKVFQPSIISVTEEDESCTVQLKHITPLKVCTAPCLFVCVGYAVLP